MDHKSAKPQHKDSFRNGFIAGWMKCEGSRERAKDKLKEIAEAAAENYIRENERNGEENFIALDTKTHP